MHVALRAPRPPGLACSARRELGARGACGAAAGLHLRRRWEGGLPSGLRPSAGGAGDHGSRRAAFFSTILGTAGLEPLPLAPQSVPSAVPARVNGLKNGRQELMGTGSEL